MTTHRLHYKCYHMSYDLSVHPFYRKLFEVPKLISIVDPSYIFVSIRMFLFTL